jgi:putative hemolysin
MRNAVLALVLAVFGFLLFGCIYQTMPGSDKDAHGCIPSAGYTWCEQQQKCVRLWETPCTSAVIDAVVPLPKPTTTPSSPTAPEAKPPETPNTQLPNPASVYCVQNNGSLRIIETESGQVGICTLPSGEDCEEWAFYRGECPKLMVGNDTDEHGCIGSAGYAWCVGLQQCIRPWETQCPVSITPTNPDAGLPPSTQCVQSVWCAAKNKCIKPSEESCSG